MVNISYDMTSVSLIVTLHNEGIMAGPTFVSLERAIQEIDKKFAEVNRKIFVDCPSLSIENFLQKNISKKWDIQEFTFRDQGLLRNEAINNSEDDLIAFFDGDDLCSRNWFSEGLEVYKKNKKSNKVILHPELNIFFENTNNVFVKRPDDSPFFDPYLFYFRNYYDALCLAPREAYIKHPLNKRRLEQGFAFEDWQWSIDTSLNEYRHCTVKDTIIFKRRRKVSQNTIATSSHNLFERIEPLKISSMKNFKNTSVI